ncbi:MAG: lytic murein transglycosylase B [Gammaproteobacteria bacterium RIFCSPHIGHO2_12_FULL_43_28]|nr:MAG: lytic murein transglycosylase B [Gammaproteobacteria bacterium RIFCSPHIGHO2_12_FULL_43_28]
MLAIFHKDSRTILRRITTAFFLLWLMGYALFFQTAHADKAFSEQQEVKTFINDMVGKYHFDKQKLTILFNNVELHPQVIQSLSKPLEIKPWSTYQLLFVSEWRIEHGVKFWKKHEVALKAAEKKFGVPASIIVATIGVETRYGQKTGGYRVIDSLSNIAFSDSPRAGFFRKELEEFLLLTREQQFDPLKVMGSYAGAIGQPQFMPSSYRHYAIDFSGTGKADLMNDEVDVIGSVANYYKEHGWKTNGPVAVQALLVGNRYRNLKDKDKIKEPIKITNLHKYGIAPKTKVANKHDEVKIIELPSLTSSEYWLGYRNFDVIKRYNSSNLYAMAVYQLSQYITALKERTE